MVHTLKSKSSKLVTPVNRVSGQVGRGIHEPRFTELDSEPTPIKVELANDIARQLWARLHFARLADETGHRGTEQIIRIASLSFSQIASWHGDLRRLADSLCDYGIELRGDTISPDYRGKLFDAIKADVLGNVFQPPPRSFIDYLFADLDPDSAFSKAAKQLESLCTQVANQLIALLDQLQRQSIVGSVHTRESTCRFSFHGRIAIIKQTGPSHSSTRRRLDPKYAESPFQAYFIDKRRRTPATVEHRNATHVHHVRNPVQRRPDETEYPIPKRFRELLETVPEWLTPYVRILEGNLFRGDSIEHETRVEERWEDTIVTRWERCPAILIGDYVLAGWGDEAITHEEQQEQRESDEERRRLSMRVAERYRRATKYVGIAAIGTMVCSYAGGPGLAAVAILLGIGAMALAMQAGHHLYSDRRADMANLSLLHGVHVGSRNFAIQSLVFGVLYLSLSAFVLAGFLAGVARYCTLRIRHATSRKWVTDGGRF